jgi:putative solute:sodium symporter small subunit
MDGNSTKDTAVSRALNRYWRANLVVMLVLLAVWAVLGLGLGVLFVDELNDYMLGGFPVGFWFAQQGSIIGFVVIVLVYAVALNRLDAHHHKEITKLRLSND